MDGTGVRFSSRAPQGKAPEVGEPGLFGKQVDVKSVPRVRFPPFPPEPVGHGISHAVPCLMVMRSPEAHTWEDIERLTAAVLVSKSISGVIRALGIARSSKRIRLVRDVVEAAGLDTSHFRSKLAFTDQQLERAAKTSTTYKELMECLGVRPGGGSYTYFKMRLGRAGVSCKHFKGRGWSKGTRSLTRRSWQDILVVQTDRSYKTRTVLLRRALLESGVLVVCATCGQGSEWMGQHLTLQIDHINGDCFDHRPGNIRFLCPNCHTQTPTYGNKAR